jgi:hypothetical protein
MLLILGQCLYLVTQRLLVPVMALDCSLLMAETFVDSRGSFRKLSSPSRRQGIFCPVGCIGSILESVHHTVLVILLTAQSQSIGLCHLCILLAGEITPYLDLSHTACSTATASTG